MDPDALSLDELLVDLNKWDRVNELIIEHEEFDVIPANGSYSGTRTPLDSATNSEKRLTKVLAELDSEYHYIILDCPPSLDSFAKNGILAARQLIIPVAPIYEMIHSTNLLMEMIEDIERVHDIDIAYLAFILSNVNYGTLSTQDEKMIDWFWDTFEQVGFEIRHRAAFDRGKWDGGSIYTHNEARNSDQFDAFEEFTEAIIDRTDAPPLTDTASDTPSAQPAHEGQ